MVIFEIPEEAKQDHDFIFAFDGGIFDRFICNKCGIWLKVYTKNYVNYFKQDWVLSEFKRKIYTRKWVYYQKHLGWIYNDYTCNEMMIKDIIE
jgi:hypothetical protein